MHTSTSDLKAMVFAAGLGTRLRPLTNDRPKALVELHGKTLLQHALEHLKSFGIREVVLNIHHFGEKVLETLAKHDNFGMQVQISDERGALLETGGGLKKAAPYFSEQQQPIVVYNVDVLSNIDLSQMLAFHLQHQALATLAIRQRQSSRYLLFDEQHQLAGWTNTKTKEIRMARLVNATTSSWAFSGVHLIDPKLLSLLSEVGKFSIIDSYLRLAEQHCLMGYAHDNDYWFDVGKPERLEAAAAFLGSLA